MDPAPLIPPLPEANRPRRRSLFAILLVVAVIVSLIVGGLIGFILGLAFARHNGKFLSELLRQTQFSSADQPISYQRDSFSFKYPSTWSFDVDDEDYDPDHFFFLDGPGTSFVMVSIKPSDIDPAEALKIRADKFKSKMRNLTVTPLNSYGAFTGQGLVLHGDMSEPNTTVRIFCMSHQGMRVAVIQCCPETYAKPAQPGFDLIEKTFSLAPAK